MLTTNFSSRLMIEGRTKAISVEREEPRMPCAGR